MRKAIAITILALALSRPSVDKLEKINTMEPISAKPEPIVEVVVEPEPIEEVITQREREVLAKLLYGEANYGCVSDAERAMVIWCVLNRIDTGLSWFGTSIENIVKNPGQFTGYHESSPVTPENLSLVDDVVSRWNREKNGEINVGRTLPKEYLFFVADGTGKHNRFYRWSSGGIGNPGDCKVWYDHTAPIANPY